jgi:hypothetical protein
VKCRQKYSTNAIDSNSSHNFNSCIHGVAEIFKHDNFEPVSSFCNRPKKQWGNRKGDALMAILACLLFITFLDMTHDDIVESFFLSRASACRFSGDEVLSSVAPLKVEIIHCRLNSEERAMEQVEERNRRRRRESAVRVRTKREFENNCLFFSLSKDLGLFAHSIFPDLD